MQDNCPTVDTGHVKHHICSSEKWKEVFKFKQAKHPYWPRMFFEYLQELLHRFSSSHCYHESPTGHQDGWKKQNKVPLVTSGNTLIVWNSSMYGDVVHSVIRINYNLWVQLHTLFFFFFGRGQNWLAHHQMFLEHWVLNNRSSFLELKL